MAYTFDGNDDIDLGAPSAITSLGTGAVAAWVNPSILSGQQVIFSASDGGDVSSRVSLFAGTFDRIWVSNEEGVVWNLQGYGDTILSAGTLYHLIWQQTGSGYEMFVNGVKQTITVNAGRGAVANIGWFSNVGNIDDVYIGRVRLSGSSIYFNGDIAEIGLWNNFLTTAEALTLSKGYSPLLVQPSNLVSYWDLVRGANDRIGGHNGIVTGAVVSSHPGVINPYGES